MTSASRSPWSGSAGSSRRTTPRSASSPASGSRRTRVPPPLKINLFRIVQEAFNNAARHGQADLIALTLESNHEAIALTVRDNGRGFDPLEARRRYRKGMGLSSMRERADLTGGTFTLLSEPGKGTTLSFSWLLAGRAGA